MTRVRKLQAAWVVTVKERNGKTYLIETNIMANIKYFPNNGTTNEVGGIISTTRRKNTWRLISMDIDSVTWNHEKKSGWASVRVVCGISTGYRKAVETYSLFRHYPKANKTWVLLEMKYPYTVLLCWPCKTAFYVSLLCWTLCPSRVHHSTCRTFRSCEGKRSVDHPNKTQREIYIL